MDESTKNLAEVLLLATQLLVVLGGALWAYYRFRAEGTHKPRVEFAVSANFLGPQGGFYPTEIVISANNKGLRKRIFKSIRLRVRGSKAGEEVEEWEENKPRLKMPHKIVDAEVIHQQRYGHIFVEPGVNQNITYLTPIPKEYRFVTVRVEFRYDDERTHSAERMFEISDREDA